MTNRAARAATATRSGNWPLAAKLADGQSGTAPALMTGISLSSSLPDDEGSWNGYRMGDGSGGGGGEGRADGGGDFDDDDDDDDMRAVDKLMARGRNRRRDAAAMSEAANMIRDSKTATRLRVRTAAARKSAANGDAGVGTGGRFVGNMAGGGGAGGGSDDLEDDSSLGSDADGSYSDLDLAAGLQSDEDEDDDDENDDGTGGDGAEKADRSNGRRMLRRTDAVSDVGESKASKTNRAGMSDEDF